MTPCNCDRNFGHFPSSEAEKPTVFGVLQPEMKDSDYNFSHDRDHMPSLELYSFVRGAFVMKEPAASFFTVAAEYQGTR